MVSESIHLYLPPPLSTVSISVLNNSVDWLLFGKGSYFLLSLIVASLASEGGLFITHQAQPEVQLFSGSDGGFLPDALPHTLPPPEKYTQSHTLACHTGRHRLSWRTDNFLNG